MPTVKLTADRFKEEVFDYTKEKDWKFKGDKPAIIDFYADWCVTCKELESFVFVDPSVQTEFQRFTLIKVDVTANDDAAIALNKAYDIIGPPAQIFYDPKGNLLKDKTLIGVPTVADFVALLRSI